MTSHLFSPLTLRGVELPNRIGVSPMCQYSATDGFPDAWHLVHLGSRAVGGAGLVFTEAAAVTAEGRISPQDLGIWSDAHADALAPIAAFVRAQGAVPAIQLAHAGRKASTLRPWSGNGAVAREDGGWEAVGPGDVPYNERYPVPRALSAAEVAELPEAFALAAERAVRVGFELLEVHAAHGYLLHEFLSPLSNDRTDAYGGDLEGRMRLVLEVTRAVREAIGERLALSVRISASDWVQGGWTVEDSVVLATALREAGADLVDCSSGGNDPRQEITLVPGYQVPFAERVRKGAGVATAAVGLITEPEQADAIVREGRADVVLLARELLRDPYWPHHAAVALGDAPQVPDQYARAY